MVRWFIWCAALAMLGLFWSAAPTAKSATITTSPPPNGTVNFGNVLVGYAFPGTGTITVTRGGSGTLSGNFPSVSGEFSGPVLGGTSFSLPIFFINTTSRTYTYTPTARGTDVQGVQLTHNGTNVASPINFTFQGTGVAPQNQVTTNSTVFARVGTTATATVTVTNVGDGNQSGVAGFGDILAPGLGSNLNGVAGPALGNAQFSGPLVTLISLADGASQNINFTYTADATRGNPVDSATVTLLFVNGSSDGTNSSQLVNATLDALTVGPVYASNPPPGSTLDFGAVDIGNTASLTIDISNVTPDGNLGSLTDLTITGFSIFGPDASNFSLPVDPSGTVIPAGGLYSLLVNFNPMDPAGVKNATLRIFTDENAPLGGNGSFFDYQLTGVAVPEPASLTLFGLASLGLGGYVWRRRKQTV